MNRCKNCKYVFEFYDIDEYREIYYEYFCHLDGSVRPPCGSIEMEGEYFGMPMEGESYQVAYEKWLAWAERHLVCPDDLCDSHEKK